MLKKEKEWFIDITTKKIEYIIKEVESILEHRKKLYKRYIRKEKGTEIMKSNKKIDELTGLSSTIVPWEYLIVTKLKGYLTGKPPEYTVISRNTNGNSEESDKYQEIIDDIVRYNDAKNAITDVVHDYLTTGAGYIYVTENYNNEIEYISLNSRDTVVFYDYGIPPYPVAMVRIYEVEDDKGELNKKIEIITDTSRRIFTETGKPYKFYDYSPISGELEEMTIKEMHWNDVPIIPFEQPDGLAVYEPVLDLIDAYEDAISGLRFLMYFNAVSAKLIAIGWNPPIDIQERIAEEKRILESRFLAMNGLTKLEWLYRDPQHIETLAVADRYLNDIFAIIGIPNMNKASMASAQSGDSKRIEFDSQEQYAITPDGILKKGLKRMWELITNRINFKNQTEYDFRMIEIILHRNLPVDTYKNMQMALLAKQIGFSTETALKFANSEIDITSELNRKSEEKLQINDIGELFALKEQGIFDKEAFIGKIEITEELKERLLNIG
ncbi:MAG: phage portal protein [Firmicutes bacterium]|nr:phage portal protein [Bacillota bacterium]